MPTDLSLLPPHAQFLHIYRRLKENKELFKRTPIVFCEGDSWFSTPLAMNIIDWLVFPTPEEEERGVPLVGRGGLFYRDERSGSLATKMFTREGIRKLMAPYKAFEFDIALLSGGGNDFVGDFLKTTFARKPPMTVSRAIAHVSSTGRFAAVKSAYEDVLAAMIAARPMTRIIGHTYAYPVRIGRPADLTLANIGAVALLRKNAGPWIGPNVQGVLPAVDDQRLFARKLIDAFAEEVMMPLAADRRFL